MCVCIPQAATEDHGICRDAERRGCQGCGPGLSKWVRRRHARTQTWIHSLGERESEDRESERRCLIHSHSHRGYLCDVLFTVGIGPQVPTVNQAQAGNQAAVWHESSYHPDTRVFMLSVHTEKTKITHAEPPSHPTALKHLSLANLTACQEEHGSTALMNIKCQCLHALYWRNPSSWECFRQKRNKNIQPLSAVCSYFCVHQRKDKVFLWFTGSSDGEMSQLRVGGYTF